MFYYQPSTINYFPNNKQRTTNNGHLSTINYQPSTITSWHIKKLTSFSEHVDFYIFIP